MQFCVTPLWNKHTLKLRYVFELAKTKDEALQSVLPHANALRHMPSGNVIRSELAPGDFTVIASCASQAARALAAAWHQMEVFSHDWTGLGSNGLLVTDIHN